MLNPKPLQNVAYQVEEICIKVVRRYGLALQYVEKQTDAICLEAVKQNGNSLQYVRN